MEAVYRGKPGRVVVRIWHEVTGETRAVVFAFAGPGRQECWESRWIRGADLEGLVINGQGKQAPTGERAGG